jgi:hypothetical protein
MAIFTAKSPLINDFLVTPSISLSRLFPSVVLFFMLYCIDGVMVKLAKMEKSRLILDDVSTAKSYSFSSGHCVI